MVSLDEVVHDLYSLAPGEFTAARNQRATQATGEGDRELAARIRRLPKPSVAAWAVNMLVRHRPDEVDELLDLGERMRSAQDELDRDAIQTLGRERQRMLSAIGKSARDLGDELGTAVSESAAIEVQQSLQAGMGDAAAATAVRSGALVRTFSGSGLDPVDLDGAVAVPITATGEAGPNAATFDEVGARRRLKDRVGATTRRAPQSDDDTVRDDNTAGGNDTDVDRRRNGDDEASPAPPDKAEAAAQRKARDEERARAQEEARAEARAEAKREAEETRQDAEDAETEVATLDLRIRDLVEKRDRLAQELRDLKDQVEAVQDELSETESARSAARKERLGAQRTADATQRTAARARKRLDSLR